MSMAPNSVPVGLIESLILRKQHRFSMYPRAITNECVVGKEWRICGSSRGKDRCARCPNERRSATLISSKDGTLKLAYKSNLRILEDYMAKMMFTFALLLLISGCEDMKMDRKNAKRLQPENQVSQRNAD
jgi:hypothetical protein